MSVTRRAALAMLLTSPLAAPHIARAQSRRLRLGHNNNVASVIHAAATGFGQALTTASEGRLTVEIVPNNALGNELQMMRAVSEGSLDMSMPPVGTTASLVKEVGLVETLYLFRDITQARVNLDGALGRHCAELLKGQGFEVLGWAEVGQRNITANKPVRRPADLQGLKIRVPVSQAIQESFIALGAVPAQLPFAQLPEALRTGQFEAQENPISIIAANKLTQFQSHLSLTGHAYTSAALIVSNDVMEELSEADRALIRRCAPAGVQASRTLGDQQQAENLATLRAAGTIIVTDVDIPAMQAAATATRDRIAQAFGAEPVKRIASLIG